MGILNRCSDYNRFKHDHDFHSLMSTVLSFCLERMFMVQETMPLRYSIRLKIATLLSAYDIGNRWQ